METNEKVVLPKEVAEAIEAVWNNIAFCERQGEFAEQPIKIGWLTNWGALVRDYPKEYDLLSEYFEKKPITYVMALVNGYKVEESPEEKLRDYFERVKPCSIRNTRDGFYVNKGRRMGIKAALNILGITVEGVNDK